MRKKYRHDEQVTLLLPEDFVHDTVLYFELPGVLPEPYRFAFHERLRTLNLLGMVDSAPRLIRDQQFTRQEVSVLLPLLHAYPAFCPYEVLHAHFTYEVVTEQEITESQQRLAAAVQDGDTETFMRPLRNVLSRARLKLHVFHMDIVTMQAVGCFLLVSPRHNAR